VSHRRFAPKTHALSYRIFQLVVDLDEAKALDRRLRLFSFNRAGLFSLHDADHGDGHGESIVQFVGRTLSSAGVEGADGRILIQCMPRILGFVFNPLTLYYCHSAQGALAAIIYEVHNTFGERHCYVAPVKERAGEGPVRHACAKAFHVSPFLGMDISYAFRVVPPGERVLTVVRGIDPQGSPVIHASFVGERRELTDRALLAAFLAYPLMTAGVVAAIHFEALKLWLKGLRLWPRPPSPATPVTLATPMAGAP
jgi:hypothetical protein